MTASRTFQAGASLLAALLLGACASASEPKGVYPAAVEQQLQRNAAEAPAGTPADSEETYLRLVAQMQRDGLWFASLAHIDALEQRWGSTSPSVRLRADALRQTEQPDAARAAYEKLVGTPLEAAGYHGLGLIAASRRDDAEAIRFFELARQRNPTDGVLLGDLGYAHLRAGRIAEARIPLMQAIQLKPDDPQVQVNVALYLQASGQAAQAEALMNAYKMAPRTRTAVHDGALSLVELQRNGGAESATPRPIAGEVANLSYQRYLDSFKRPIPEHLSTTVRSAGAGRASP
ncbi:MAG: Tetratricopeptide domain protein [Variovorax sp.]|nr:Tetratricopeptide domain protein [Variovorax sp.]